MSQRSSAALRKQSSRPKVARRLTLEALGRRDLCALMADLVAYRPVTEAIDYSKYAIPEAVEADLSKGPGIRINGDDDNRNGKADYLDKSRSLFTDDDLVRVDVRCNAANTRISWSGDLAVWTSANKRSAVTNGQQLNGNQTLWVEYVGTNHSQGAKTTLTLVTTTGNATASDQLVFHTFQSEVVVIGGASASPILHQGVFEIGVGLYQEGYDVHLFRNIAVNRQGTGASLGLASAYDEVSNAILQRGVSNIALVGISYGGGAVHDLAKAMEGTPSLRGRIQYTAYIDAIEHYSIPPAAERRLPPGTKYHDNFFQHNDWLIQGDTVSGANRNIDVSSWRDSRGRKLVHIAIDRDAAVQTEVSTSLKSFISVR